MITDPRLISIDDYTYPLPEERIAKYPLEERDKSRLAICQKGSLKEDQYCNLASYLPTGSLLVFNNTKVVEARLLFKKDTGGTIEIFCLEPHEQYPDVTTAMLQKGKVLWHCLVGGASKWKPGQVLKKTIPLANANLDLFARYIEKRAGSFVIELSWEPASCCFAEILHCAGAIPLPPYIKREAEGSDTERYQTVYARLEGSVAAPTAGLHFTPAIFSSLKKKNIDTAFLTLHVGAGTFKPVKSATMADHDMHAEWIDVDRATIEKILTNLGNPIVAVGTTSLRTLESLYWLGAKSVSPDTDSSTISMQLSQWEAYQLAEKEIPVRQALESLLKWMDVNRLDKLVTKTQILILPGYSFRVISGLITNFHQPQSTLLLLVAALIGDDWKTVYNYALANNFRFLSYGDGCLLWGEDRI